MEVEPKTNSTGVNIDSTLNWIIVVILTFTIVVVELTLIYTDFALLVFILPASVGLGGIAAGKIKRLPYSIKVSLIIALLLIDVVGMLNMVHFLGIVFIICFFAFINFCFLFVFTKKGVGWKRLIFITIISTLVFSVAIPYFMLRFWFPGK